MRRLGVGVVSLRLAAVVGSVSFGLVCMGAGTAAAAVKQTKLPLKGVGNPYDVAVDRAGDVFVTNYGPGAVFELPALANGRYGRQVRLPFKGLCQPAGVAVDAAGDVFVTSSICRGAGRSEVLELPVLSSGGYGRQMRLPFAGLSQAWGIAVNKSRDVFVMNINNGNTGAGEVLESRALNGGHYGKPVKLPFRSLPEPSWLAVDTAGDVFAMDAGGAMPPGMAPDTGPYNAVVELPARPGRRWGTLVTLPFTDLSGQGGLAVDAAGDIFVANENFMTLLELHAGSQTPKRVLPSSLTYMNGELGIAAGTGGHLFIVNNDLEHDPTFVLSIPL